MGKKPLTREQIQQIRILVKGKPLHELLLNLGIDLMLRSSDLRSLKVSDVLNPSGTVKESVSVKQIKTGKRTLAMPIMDNSRNSIAEHDVDAVRRLLGQSSVTATSAYLGVTDNSALELAKSINL